MSKALSTKRKVINRWLGAQLIDRPNPANHPDYTAILGGQGPLKSIRELLETIINKSEWSWEIGQALDQLGFYFHLPESWWKDRVGMGTWLLNPIAAAFADAWIYRQWLHFESPQTAQQFAEFFAKSVMHPEWVAAVDSMWVEHYPLVGGNLYQTIPHAGDLMYSDQLKGTPWYPNYLQKIGKELIRRSFEAEQWLRDVFTSSDQEKPQKLEIGLSHISLAAMKGDTTFFIGLGKALSENFEPHKTLSLEQIQNQPTSKSRKGITIRQWCRRVWISRGLWLLPPHLLQQPPFSLSQATISELTGKRYRDNKRLPQNDELYRAKSHWFNEWRDDNTSISLNAEGKKLLPQFAETGLPWSIVSADFE
ncbi:hypothetical protein OAL33_00250 [Akkermansiaceae bacterium]|nr:hypothetical protein [Akkermansiaceae bacterium]